MRSYPRLALGYVTGGKYVCVPELTTIISSCFSPFSSVDLLPSSLPYSNCHAAAVARAGSGCSVTCSRQRTNSSGTSAASRPKYPEEGKSREGKGRRAGPFSVGRNRHSPLLLHEGLAVRARHSVHLFGWVTRHERPLTATGFAPRRETEDAAVDNFRNASLPPSLPPALHSPPNATKCDIRRRAAERGRGKRCGRPAGRAGRSERGGLMKIPGILEGTTPKGEWAIRYFISRVPPSASASASASAAAASRSNKFPFLSLRRQPRRRKDGGRKD